MESDLRQLSSRVSSEELQTHDEIRRAFLDIIQGHLQEQLGLLAFVKMERDVGGGYYDARIGNLYFEIKRPEDGIQAGIDDAEEYLHDEPGDLDFITTEGLHGAFVTRTGVVEQGELQSLAPRLQTLVENAVTSPTTSDIVDAFGPNSERVQVYITLLWNIFQAHNDLDRVQSAFEAWKKIYAESANLSSDARRAVEQQAQNYGLDVTGREDSYQFLFVVQTYFAIFLKLFAARLSGDYDSTEDRLDLGTWPGSYRQLSIETDVVEHDLFDWFLDPARKFGGPSHQLEDMVMRLANSVDVIDPARIDEDVLRELYQNSFDSSTRKAMGEFYTNDQLVDEVLDNVGYSGDNILREAILLDPTCGSGTFLFHAIRRYVEAGEAAGLNNLQIARGVGENIHGIDLHPFAVAMARTNYLLALGERAEYLEQVPVYWTDSIASATQQTLSGERVSVATLGSIEVPTPEDIDHYEVFRAMELALEGGWSKNRFLGEFEEGERTRYETTLSNIYTFFIEEIHNGMWVPAFRDVAAIRDLKGDCDYLVGNPPWVRRRNVDESIRTRLDEDFEFYRGAWRPPLSEVTTFIGSRDYSLAFLEAGLEYLHDEGDLGLVITSNIIRTLYAGSARSHLLNETKLTHLRDHSFSPEELFPDADNAPLVLCLEKREPGSDHEVNVSLLNREGEERSWQLPQSSIPLLRDDPSSPWLLLPEELNSAVRAMQDGRDFLGNLHTTAMGIKTARNDDFFVEDIQSADVEGEVVIETQGGETVRIEAEMLQPLVRGKNVDAWEYDIDEYIIWTHDSEGTVREELPEFASRYFDDEERMDRLRNRSDYNSNDPVWIIFRVEKDKMGEKVAWQKIAKTIEGVWLPSTIDTDLGERSLIVDSNVQFIPLEENGEQFEGLLNSAPAKVYASGYVNRTGGRYTALFAWVIGMLPVPTEIVTGSADSLSELSENLHLVGEEAEDDELERLDEIVGELYGLEEDTIQAMKDYLEFFTN